MFYEVLCNHALSGVHKGETRQTTNLHALDGMLVQYKITPAGRLELLEYTIEDRSDPTREGIERLFSSMTTVFTGGRRDLTYHGWLELEGIGRAKFTDGTMVGLEPELERSQHKRRDCPNEQTARNLGASIEALKLQGMSDKEIYRLIVSRRSLGCPPREA